MKENDEKIREILEEEKVPKELEPENVKTMLDEKSHAKKRSKISVAGRVTASIAACAVICGSGAYALGKFNKATDIPLNEVTQSNNVEVFEQPEESNEEVKSDNAVEEESEDESSEDTVYTVEVDAPYMNGAESYEQIYSMLKERSEELTKDGSMKYFTEYAATADSGMVSNSDALIEESEEVYNSEDYDDNIVMPEEAEIYDESGVEYSETYNQEENVLEADIVKTDGKFIYYLHNEYYYDKFDDVTVLNIAGVDNGTFTSTNTIDLTPDLGEYDEENYNRYIDVNDMYIYNDMIIVIGTANTYYTSMYYYVDGTGESIEDLWYDDSTETFVSFYTTGENPELIGTYHQDGYYRDVRITPNGYMYLVSSYTSLEYSAIKEESNIDRYIPSCGVGDDVECIAPECILLPEEYEPSYWLDYTVIGSIDLNTTGQFNPIDQKALAGYTGDIYASADNIYTAIGWENTEITRISTADGFITPVASGTVSGYIKDQFSMSEYNGYFRVATTIYESNYNQEYGVTWIGSGNYNNCVYVLDMDLNVVGSISDFGIDETIKSVNFNGDTAYVVTYEQTDPLFAIDLSNPEEPAIMDEFKILGYSTYMQKWADGLLLGFGVDADENGIENGVKLVMFDNSDPYDLKEVGLYQIHKEDDDSWLYSDAVWERKALLIAPEKNIIGVPVYSYNYSNDYSMTTKYMFFSYDNGEFTFKGEISKDGTSSSNFNRAVYIGDYVYVLSGDRFVSADIETITETDNAYFS